MRPIHHIADEIRADWKNIYFGAVPYLEAMFFLNTIHDQYGADDAKSIVAYFLANANTWRGPTARRIKKELNTMLKAGWAAYRSGVRGFHGIGSIAQNPWVIGGLALGAGYAIGKMNR